MAVGYKAPDDWISGGWWNIQGNACEVVLGSVPSRYIYVHAIEDDNGGTWDGDHKLCVKDKSFSIRGITNCIKRGLDSVGFMQIDTGSAESWIVRLK